MAYGDIGAVIEEFLYEEEDIGDRSVSMGVLQHIYGDVYAIFYSGGSTSTYGTIKTLTITSAGDIGSVIATATYSTSHSVNFNDVLRITGTNIFIITSSSPFSTYEGYVTTISVSNVGVISSQIDEYLFAGDEATTDAVYYPTLVHVYGTIYAVAYRRGLYTGSWAYTGVLKTLTISNAGDITESVVDTLVFDASACNTPYIKSIDGGYFAIVYQGVGGDGFVKTVDIDNTGNIGSVQATLEFDTASCSSPHIVRLSSTYHAIFYAGNGDDGYVKTLTLSDSDGSISAIIDTWEFDSSQARAIKAIKIAPLTYLAAYEGYVSPTSAHGYTKTITISDFGVITKAVIDTLVFDADVASGFSVSPIQASSDTIAILTHEVSQYPAGHLFTIEIEGIVEWEEFPSDALTRVTSLTHRYDRGTYTLELGLGEVTADFGIPSWLSRPVPGIPSEPAPGEETIICPYCGLVIPISQFNYHLESYHNIPNWGAGSF